MMVADVAQFNVVGAEKFENDPIGTIDAEAPDFVVLGAKLFAMQRWVKGVFPKEIGFRHRFALNRLGKFGK